MDNVSREMGILIKNKSETLEIKNTVMEMKMALTGSYIDWQWLKKDLWVWRYDSRNFQNGKAERKKTKKKKKEREKIPQNTISKPWRESYNVGVMV